MSGPQLRPLQAGAPHATLGPLGLGGTANDARLTAIRSFFHQVAASDPGALAIAQRVLDIPCKRTALLAPRHLSTAAVDSRLSSGNLRRSGQIHIARASR